MMTDDGKLKGGALVWLSITVLGTGALLAQLAAFALRPALPAAEVFAAPVVVSGEALRGAIHPKAHAAPSPKVEDVTGLLVDAIIQIESGGRPDSVGAAGERGLMQVKASTWNEVTENLFGRPVDFDTAFDPEMNRQVGRAYLAWLENYLHRHRTAWNSDLRSLLLACYNAGPTRVRKAGFDLSRLPSSTQRYIARATALHDTYLAGGVPAIQLARRPAPVRGS